MDKYRIKNKTASILKLDNNLVLDEELVLEEKDITEKMKKFKKDGLIRIIKIRTKNSKP